MQKKIVHWFKQHKRDLPWRESPTPYRVWVSEVMLQQTQVAVVIPYFLRWMERFPTIESLAQAPIEEVIKLWEGLGYYSRARNLHEGAKQICEHFQGEVPHDGDLLAKIKGIGPYTKGAILSFAFHKKAPVVDGNVIRVLSRYYALMDDMCKPSGVKAVWKLAESQLPDEEPWIFNEGLIELGATVCTKKPQCLHCPIRSGCQGYQQGIAEQLPKKNKREETVLLFREVALIEYKGEVLVRKCSKGEIMQDLFEFPYCEIGLNQPCEERLKKWINDEFRASVTLKERLPSTTHSFTKHRATLYPSRWLCEKKVSVDGFGWHPLNSLTEIPFNSGHRRIISLL